jgi:hypothetical protein
MEHINFFRGLAIVVVFIFSPFTNGQILDHYNGFDVYWGKSYRDIINVQDIIRTKDNSYICVNTRTNFLNFFKDYQQRFYFEPIHDYLPTKRKKVELYGAGEKTKLEDYTVLNDQLVLISQRKESSDNSSCFYYHFLNPESNNDNNHGFHFSTTYIPNTLNNNNIKLFNTEDRSKASYLFTLQEDRELFTKYEFGFFDAQYNLNKSPISIFPLKYKNLRITETLLDSSDHIILLSERGVENQEALPWENQVQEFRKRTIFILEKDTLIEIPLTENELLFDEVKMILEKEQIILSGLYSENLKSAAKGVFLVRIDREGKVIEQKFTRFSEELLMEGNETPANLTFQDGMMNNSFQHFQMRELHPTKDGGFIGIAEHFDTEQQFSGTGAPGTNNRIDMYYYYNNILVYKLDSSGRLLWNTIIRKKQHSINDSGYFLSFAHYINDSSLYLIFNDNDKNYTAQGKFMRNIELKTAYFNSWRNVIGFVKINLETGQKERRTIGGKRVNDTILVPKLCVANRSQNELFLYGRNGQKHRFGSINFITQ